MASKRILIVDDDPNVREILTRRLRHSGYECCEACSVETARHELMNFKPHLILLDLSLGKFDGTAFLKHFEDWVEEGGDIPPIIVLSAFNSPSVVEYSLNLGAKGFIRKPYDPSILLSMVSTYTS